MQSYEKIRIVRIRFLLLGQKFEAYEVDILFFLVGLLQLSASVQPDQKLSLDMRNAKVAEVLDAIESQSDSGLPTARDLLISIESYRKLRDKTIDESLKEVLQVPMLSLAFMTGTFYCIRRA